MKKLPVVLALAFFAGLTFYAATGSAQMGPGMMGGYGPGQGYSGGGQYGEPNYGYGMGWGRGYGMGQGMIGGYGMGPGMMGQGYGYYGPRSGYGSQYKAPKPLTKEEATQEVQNYLESTRNPNLKLGAVQEKGNDFEADIVTKDGSLIDKLLVNKDTGWMRPAY